MSSVDKHAKGVSWTGDMSSFMQPEKHKLSHIQASVTNVEIL